MSDKTAKQVYNKEHLTFSQQVALLKNRGMKIENEKLAEHILATVGYYRMSGYWYPFREMLAGQKTKRADKFVEGVSFREINNLYLFDKRLRSVLFEMITDIEVAFRCKIAYTVGEDAPFDYCVPASCAIEKRFHKQHAEWISKHEMQIKKSKEAFVEHYKETYKQPFPIWISCELWDFGMTSALYGMLLRKYKDGIAESLGIKNSSVLVSWLRSLNFIRNVCAHNARLWNRTLVATPSIKGTISGLEFLSEKYTDPQNNKITPKIAPMIFIILWLTNKILPGSALKSKLARALDSFSWLKLPGIGYSDMGFKDDWKNEDVWREY